MGALAFSLRSALREDAAVQTGTIVVLISSPHMTTLRNKEPTPLEGDRGWTIVLLVVACAVVALYVPFFWEYAHG